MRDHACMKPLERISTIPCKLAEGCLWHSDERRLYWVDILQGRLLCHDPATGETAIVNDNPDSQLGGFTIQADGALLLFRAKGRVERYADGRITEALIDSLPEERDSRFNDLIADPAGRIFAGTVATPKHDAQLYRLDADRSIHSVQQGIGCSNGLGFSPDCKTLYYIDSGPNGRQVWAYDFDADAGGIRNRRTVVDYRDTDGQTPDGMTVDAAGNLWAAIWNGAAVMNWTSTGEVIQKIDVPQATCVTCVTFGGPTLTDLYITTATNNATPAQADTAGHVYMIPDAGQGKAEFRSRIGL